MAAKKTLQEQQAEANAKLIEAAKAVGVNTGDLPIVVDGETALNLVNRIIDILAKLAKDHPELGK